MSLCSAKTNLTIRFAVLDVQLGNLYYRNEQGLPDTMWGEKIIFYFLIITVVYANNCRVFFSWVLWVSRISFPFFFKYIAELALENKKKQIFYIAIEKNRLWCIQAGQSL